MPIVKSREYRSMATLLQESVQLAPYHVRGYATTWDDPYLLGEDPDGRKYYEQINRHCLEGADLTDVIMQFDHAGRVFARTSNGTLIIGSDDHGLYIEADLSTTAGARELFEEIRTGLITRMSWAFTVAHNGDEYVSNASSYTRTINRIKKVYDVSAVSYPANPDTEISARALSEGVIVRARRESLLRKLRLIELKQKMEDNLK